MGLTLVWPAAVARQLIETAVCTGPVGTVVVVVVVVVGAAVVVVDVEVVVDVVGDVVVVVDVVVGAAVVDVLVVDVVVVVVGSGSPVGGAVHAPTPRAAASAAVPQTALRRRIPNFCMSPPISPPRSATPRPVAWPLAADPASTMIWWPAAPTFGHHVRMSQWPPPIDGPDGWSPTPPSTPPPPSPSMPPPAAPTAAPAAYPPPGAAYPPPSPPPGAAFPPPPAPPSSPLPPPGANGPSNLFAPPPGYGQPSPYGEPAAVVTSQRRSKAGRPVRFGSSFWTLLGIVVVVIGLAVVALVFLRDDDGGDDVASGRERGLDTGTIAPAPTDAAPTAPPESVAPVPATPQLEPWQRTQVKSGIFSVELPSDFTSTNQEVPSPAGVANAQMLLVDRGVWALAVMDLRAPFGSTIDLRGGVDGMMMSLNGKVTTFAPQKSKLVDLADFTGSGTYAGRPITVMGRILRTDGGFAVVYSLAGTGAASEMEPQYLRLRDSLEVNH